VTPKQQIAESKPVLAVLRWFCMNEEYEGETWRREYEEYRNKLATLFNALTLAGNITAWCE